MAFLEVILLPLCVGIAANFISKYISIVASKK